MTELFTWYVRPQEALFMPHYDSFFLDLKKNIQFILLYERERALARGGAKGKGKKERERENPK